MTEITRSGIITHSYGDVFRAKLPISRALRDGENIVFSIKHSDKTVLSKAIDKIADNTCYIEFSTEEMKQLYVGNYVYDITVVNVNGNYYTPIKATKFTVIEVAHNV